MSFLPALVGEAGSLLANGGLRGTQKNLMNQQAGILSMMKHFYSLYGPQYFNTLSHTVAGGGVSPWITAKRQRAESDINDYWTQSKNDALKHLSDAGLTTSLMNANATNALARARADSMAKARTSQLGEENQTMWQALNALGQTALPMGGQAESGMGQLANAYGNQANDMSGMIKRLLEAVAQELQSTVAHK